MTLVIVVSVAVLAAGAAYWHLSARRARPPAAEPRPARPGGRFGGVEIRTRGGACRSAQRLEGRRFLAKDAPTLPLPRCTAARCSCTFAKLPDRRTEGRRLDYGSLSASLLRENNRRKQERRRAARAQGRP
jgi:hypothetical protein